MEENNDNVVNELTKLIDLKFSNIENEFLQKFEQFANQCNSDTKDIKAELKLKFGKLTKQIDESVFAILSKGHGFQNDLEKIQKKMLKLFVAPNHQNITKTLFLNRLLCPSTLDITKLKARECNEELPCKFQKSTVKDNTPNKKKYDKKDSDSEETRSYVWVTPARKHLLEKPTCTPGTNQSPIEIVGAIEIKMPAIEMIGYRNYLTAPIILKNNGYTVQFSARTLTRKEIHLGEFVPYITGGKLDGKYEFFEAHFHWGMKNNYGSEHIINGIHYPIEMQFMHKNMKYPSVGAALQNSDGLAILAFFFKLSEFEGPEIRKIIEDLKSIKNETDAVEMNITFSLSSLLGAVNLDQFYMYKGSLTTSPYSESVTWVIFPDTLKISSCQIDWFRQLHIYSNDEKSVQDNVRELQPIGNRRIFIRKANPNGCTTNIKEIHHTKWQWCE